MKMHSNVLIVFLLAAASVSAMAATAEEVQASAPLGGMYWLDGNGPDQIKPMLCSKMVKKFGEVMDQPGVILSVGHRTGCLYTSEIGRGGDGSRHIQWVDDGSIQDVRPQTASSHGVVKSQ